MFRSNKAKYYKQTNKQQTVTKYRQNTVIQTDLDIHICLFYRNEREKELSTYIETCNDRLGRVVRRRLQDMNNLLKDDKLKTTS